MKFRSLPPLLVTAWTGGAIAVLGLMVVAQWWVRWPALLALLGPLRLHGGLLLVIGGSAMAARSLQHARQSHRSTLADAGALLLIALPVLVQAQTALGVAFGVDWVREPIAPTPDNPHPGRLAPNTAIAFICAGGALWQLRQAAAARRWPVKVMVALHAAIAGSALAGYALGLEQLYRLPSFNVMLVTTAAGLVALAAGLWHLGVALTAPDLRDPQRLERHIAAHTVGTLALVALAAGGAAFAVMRTHFTASLLADARTSAVTSALALENTLQTSLWFPRTIARRPLLLQALSAAERSPDSEAARNRLHQVADGVLAAGVDGIELLAADGSLLAQAGELPAPAPAVTHPLLVPGLRAELRWQGAHVLQVEAEVRDAQQRVVGHVRTYQRLWLFDRLLAALADAGETADALVCSRRVTEIVCGPSTRVSATPPAQPMFDAASRPAGAMARALLGESGAQAGLDARGVRVVAGHAPLGELGLGLVVQADASVLHAPLRSSLHLVAMAVAALVAAGAWSLRLRARPLLQAVVDEQQRTRTILDTSGDAFISLGVDGCVTDWNIEATRLFGWTAGQARGRPLSALILPPEMSARHEAGFARFVHTGDGPVINRRIEITGRHRDGHDIPVELSISAMHTPQGYVANAFVRDIRERHDAQVRLQDSERRLHDVLNNIPAMVGHFDASERCLFANNLALKAHGLTLPQAIGRLLCDGISPASYALHRPHVALVLAGHCTRLEGQDVRQGVLMHYQTDMVPEVDAEGRVRGFYLMTFDVTEQKRAKLALERNVTALRQAEARMAELALSDALTGLANRRRFDERLPEAMARAAREQRGMALMFLDVDHFKRVNDNHGHAAGDAVLVEFGARLRAALRGTDFVARLAGDEFVVVLEGLRGADEAEQVSAKLVAGMRSPLDFEGARLAVTTSIGIAYLPAGARCTPAALLALADQALYATKAGGRNGHSCLIHGATEAALN